MMMNEKEHIETAEGKRPSAEVRRLLLRIAATLALLALFFALFGVYLQRGNAMYPALRDGDAYICFRPGNRSLAAGSVVSFKLDGTRRTARIIAASGDTVNITEDGRLFVNGKLMQEASVYYPTYPAEGGISYPYTVEDGGYFVLCDCRTDAAAIDSRAFGTLSAEDIDGHLILLFRRRGF